MQETYTTILRTNHLVATPRSARGCDSARSRKAGVSCRNCGSNIHARHPCMFCHECLLELKTHVKTKPAEKCLQHSNSCESEESDLTAWNLSLKHTKHGDRKSKEKRQSFTDTREVILNSSLSFHEDVANQVEESTEDKEKSAKEERFNRVWREKSKTFEANHSACGFCIGLNKEHDLKMYCMHCKKHLCSKHLKFHNDVKLFRPHALVNLTTRVNKFLL